MIRPVTLIILAWNRWPLTRRLLDSLARTVDRHEAAILVVDNGSSDETAEQLERYPDVRVLRLASNVGFVRGNNAGIATVPAEHDVVLLNNDVEALEPGWLDRLQSAAYSAPHVGIAGCRLVLGDGRLLHAGTFIRPDTVWGQQIGSLEMDLNQFAGTREVEGIVFACAYLKRETLDRVGLLSEEYQSYFEDTDYCLRAQEAGLVTVCAGDVTLRHDEHGSTEGDARWREELFERSRTTFRAKWQARLEQRYRQHVHWQSVTNFPTGYSMSSRELIRALDGAGARLTYQYAYGGSTPLPHDEPAGSGDYLIDLIRARPAPRRPRVAVTYAQGDVFHLNPGRYRIGFTMLEVDGFPRDWVRQANQMDEVWTPTEFNREGLLRSGVTRPVHVIPLGVDPGRFHPGIRRVPDPSGNFVFLGNFEWGERKNPGMMLRAFNGAFRHDEPAIFVCRILNRDPSIDVSGEIRALELSELGGRIHFIVNRELPHYQLATLYRSADCFVTSARAEGWGLPLMEAMACGVPAIATGWGGHTAFIDPDDTWILPAARTIPAVSRCPYYEGFSWGDPDEGDLAQLMRHVYEHREEARLKGLRASARIRSQFSWSQSAAKMIERLKVHA